MKTFIMGIVLIAGGFWFWAINQPSMPECHDPLVLRTVLELVDEQTISPTPRTLTLVRPTSIDKDLRLCECKAELQPDGVTLVYAAQILGDDTYVEVTPPFGGWK